MLTEQELKIFQKYGSKGGKKTLEKHGPEHYREIQKKSALSRRKNKIKAKIKAKKMQSPSMPSTGDIPK